MPVYRPYDPVPAYRFAVELGGEDVGFFTECRGLTVEREVVEIKEGGANDSTYSFPGRVKPGKLTLKRGVMAAQRLFDWFNEGILTGKVKRQNITIKVLSRQREAPEDFMVIQRWDLLNCWPIKYEGPELTAESLQPALESLEIAFDTILFTANTDG
jgi:phage tail-like protein